MNVLQKIVSVGRTLARGYKVEAPVRGSRSAARRWLEDALRGARSLDTLQVHLSDWLEVAGWKSSPWSFVVTALQTYVTLARVRLRL